jgi:hypothetical protein
MPVAFLLAMQAAGMVVDYIGTKNQIEMGRLGTKLEQAGIDTNLEMTRLVMAAAKGSRGNPMSLIASVSDFNADERTRRINLLGKESELRAAKILSGLHQLTSETQLGQAMTKRFFDKIPTNPAAYQGAGKAPGKASGKSFGMTEIG